MISRTDLFASRIGLIIIVGRRIAPQPAIGRLLRIGRESPVQAIKPAGRRLRRNAPPGVDESTLPPPDKSADAIGVVDPGQNKLVRKIYAGSDPEQFALSRDGKTLYVSNEDAGGLSIIDLGSGKVVATLPTGEEPEGVTLSPDGKFVYVTSENDGTVSMVDTAAAKVLKTVKVGHRPRSIA